MSMLFFLSQPFRFGLIWAQNPNGIIGVDGDLPWRVPEDLAHFKAQTLGFSVLHGRKSYEALPPSVRPLPGRNNIVLTRDLHYHADGAHVIHDVETALAFSDNHPLWVVGGGELYQATIVHADVLVVTTIEVDILGDTYAPEIHRREWVSVQQTPWFTSKTGINFRIEEFRRDK